MHEVLQTLSDLGRGVTAWCITTNLNALALLAIALIADLLIARRLAPGWRIALYLPVVLRVLIPPHVTWSVPFWQLASPTFTVERAIAVPSTAPARDLIADTAPSSPISLWPLTLYLSGVGILFANWFRGTRTIRRVVKASHISAEHPTVLISPNAGPMVAGVVHPRIIIPAWLINSDALPLILAHERAHIARHDPAFAFALRTICILAWPILPLWVAASRIRALMEHACDDLAIGAPSTRRQENIVKYARAMIDVAQRSTLLPGSLAFGAALRPRIKALRATRRWPAAFQIGIAAVLPTLLLACSAARPQSDLGLRTPQSAPRADSARNTPTSTTTSIPPSTPTATPPSTPLSAPVAATPTSQTNTAAAPETRVINLTIVSGDSHSLTTTSDKWNASVVAADRNALVNDFAWIQSTTYEASPRLVVEIGQPVTVRTDIDRRPVSAQFTVLPSDPQTVLATMSYTEGDQYTLKATTLRFNKGQTCIIRIPSAQLGMPTRTLIVDINLPGEEVGC